MWTIWSHLEPSGALWRRLEPSGTSWYPAPDFRESETSLDKEQMRNFKKNVRIASQAIWSHLELSGAIRSPDGCLHANDHSTPSDPVSGTFWFRQSSGFTNVMMYREQKIVRRSWE